MATLTSGGRSLSMQGKQRVALASCCLLQLKRSWGRSLCGFLPLLLELRQPGAGLRWERRARRLAGSALLAQALGHGQPGSFRVRKPILGTRIP